MGIISTLNIEHSITFCDHGVCDVTSVDDWKEACAGECIPYLFSKMEKSTSKNRSYFTGDQLSQAAHTPLAHRTGHPQ